MKVKHNVILILVSSKWLIPYSGDSSKFLISIVHLIFFSESSNLFQLYRHRDPSKSLQGFNLILLSFILAVHSFLTGILQRGFTWLVIKDLNLSRSVHQGSFQRSSSFLHIVIRSAILSTVSLEVVLCHSW